MKKENNKGLLVKERQEAVKEMRHSLDKLNIGEDIRMVLEAGSFSKQDLAHIIDCDRSNITDICTRENNMNLVQLILISVALEHNFLDKIFALLNPEQESILPERYTFDVTSSSVRITHHHADRESVKVFRLQR
ncbi:MAG: hypothetical protein FWG84_01355 [Bacteroidales bacterium]|nr:hypothetical protein [Bacteroidales bacterium]